MRYRALFPVLMLTASATALYGQAMVEYGINAGRSGAAAGAAGAGRAPEKRFDKVGRARAGAARADEKGKPGPAAPASATPGAPAAAAPAPAERVIPPDFSALAVGMERVDLLNKVGKPSMSMSGTESS